MACQSIAGGQPGDGGRSRGRQRGQDLNRDAAEMRIERLELSAAVRPMEDALGDAMRWLETKKDFRGEVYVFTDMAAEAWPEETLAQFAKIARCDCREQMFI